MRRDISKENRYSKSILAVLLIMSCCMIAGCADSANSSRTDADKENMAAVASEDETTLMDMNTTESVSDSVSEETETTVSIAVTGTLLSEDDNGALYELVKGLLEKRQSLQDEMEMGNGVSYSESVTINSQPYYLVTREEIGSWNDYQKLAQEIYTEDYVAELFTPTYSRLYTEANGKLYRVAADGFIDVIDWESICIYQKTENVYIITAQTEENADGSSYTLFFIAKVNEAKPYGLEIRDEVKISFYSE